MNRLPAPKNEETEQDWRMKLPIEWLREFVETPLSDDALAAHLAMARLGVKGAEVKTTLMVV